MHSWLFSTTRRLAHVGSLWLDWGSTTRWWANCTVELSGNPCLLRVDRESLVHIVGAHGPPIFFNGGKIEAEQRPAPVVVSHPISTLSTWLFDQVPWTLIKRPLREMANSRSHQIWGSTWIIMNRLCARLPMFSWLSFLCQCWCMDMPGRVQPHLYWSAECRGAAGGAESRYIGWSSVEVLRCRLKLIKQDGKRLENRTWCHDTLCVSVSIQFVHFGASWEVLEIRQALLQESGKVLGLWGDRRVQTRAVGWWIYYMLYMVKYNEILWGFSFTLLLLILLHISFISMQPSKDRCREGEKVYGKTCKATVR